MVPASQPHACLALFISQVSASAAAVYAVLVTDPASGYVMYVALSTAVHALIYNFKDKRLTRHHFS